MDDERLNRMEAEIKRLSEEVAKIRSELTASRKQGISPEFIAARGVLFKRGADGEIEPDAYCPNCKRAMWAFESMFSPKCSSRKYKAPFKADEIPSIIAKLEKRQ